MQDLCTTWYGGARHGVALSSYVLSPAKQDISHTLYRMLCAFSNFHTDASPVLSCMLDFKGSNSSTERACSLSQPAAVIPNWHCCIFHQHFVFHKMLGQLCRSLTSACWVQDQSDAILRLLTECGWDHIVAIQANQKLMNLLCATDSLVNLRNRIVWLCEMCCRSEACAWAASQPFLPVT